MNQLVHGNMGYLNGIEKFEERILTVESMADNIEAPDDFFSFLALFCTLSSKKGALQSRYERLGQDFITF